MSVWIPLVLILAALAGAVWMAVDNDQRREREVAACDVRGGVLVLTAGKRHPDAVCVKLQ